MRDRYGLFMGKQYRKTQVWELSPTPRGPNGVRVKQTMSRILASYQIKPSTLVTLADNRSPNSPLLCSKKIIEEKKLTAPQRTWKRGICL